MENNKTLVQLAGDYNNHLVEFLGEEVPITKELALEIATKVENYAHIRDQLELQEMYAKARLKEWNDALTIVERGLERLDRNLMTAMNILNVESLEGPSVHFKKRNNPPSVLIEDETKIPGKYQTTELKTSIDKLSIKRDLLRGEVVDGAILIQKQRIEKKGTL